MALKQKAESIVVQKVLSSYIRNMALLSENKQFHFNSRMFLWTRKTIYKENIFALKKVLLENLDASLENSKNPTPEYPKRFLSMRKNALEKYPWILRYNTVLFKWLFLNTIFKEDIREKILETIPEKILQENALTLLHDPLSLVSLSTFGINFLYLTRGILHSENLFHPKQLLDITKEYPIDTHEYAELRLYYFTHCIIGESQFYNKSVKSKVDTYIDMLTASEEIIKKYFDFVSIDNKVEFLVATKLCLKKSSLSERIQRECEENFSERLGYITEPRRPIEKQNMNNEEHRNVLYVMSNSEFSGSQL